MKRTNWLIALLVLGTTTLMAQQNDPIATGLGGVATVAGETKTALSQKDSSSVQTLAQDIPLWKQKLYYGYNFDIYFHHDSRKDRKENGWSIALQPEVGWKLTDRIYLGMRVGGSYANMTIQSDVKLIDTTYTADLRVHHGSWQIEPYMRYRLKTLFNGKVGIWIETHLFTGMDFPRVADNMERGTDYEGLRHSVTYGFQVSPVITYQFNKKSTFQIFFSILSIGYSGSTYCYADGSKQYINDVIIFSGKLSNMLANQFTPGLYGLKFGVQKSF